MLDDSAFDKRLKSVLKKRILRELEEKAQAASIVNNVYGGGSVQDPRKGLENMVAPDDFDYMVDITRKSDPNDPKGWSKQVMRRRIPKG